MRRTDVWHKTLTQALPTALKDSSVRPGGVCEIELGLYLLDQVVPGDPALSLAALLTGYHLPLRDGAIWTEDVHRSVALGRQYLYRFKGLPTWRRALDAYGSVPQWLRGFDVEPGGGRYSRRKPSVAPDRWDVYAAALNEPPPYRLDTLKPASAGRYLVRAGQVHATVTVPDNLPLLGFPNGHELRTTRTERQPTEPSFDDLLETARWMDAQQESMAVSKRRQWERDLRRVRFETFDERTGRYSPSNKLRICGILNAAGMVSSGKSTLMDMLAVWCARSGRRVTLVVGDVVSAVRRTTTFRNLGIQAAPILGYSNRRRHVERMHRVLGSETGQSPLEHNDPGFDFLSTACALDGLRRSASRPFLPGDNPCDGLVPTTESNLGEDENDDEIDANEARKHLGCPFFSVCQQHRAARDLVTAPIWVATPASLIYSRVPPQINPERVRYLEVAWRRSDLIIVDEADQVQVQLDTIFSPSETLLGGPRESWFEDLDERVLRELRLRGRAQMRDPGVPDWIRAFDAGRAAGNQLFALLNREPALRTRIQRNYFTEWTFFVDLIREWAGIGEGVDYREHPVGRAMSDDFDAYLAARFTGDDEPRPTEDGEPPVEPERSQSHALASITHALLVGDDPFVASDQVRAWLLDQQRTYSLKFADLDTATTNMEFVLLLSALASRLNYLVRHWRTVEDPLNLEGTGLIFHKPPEEFGALVPEAPMGNQLGFQYHHLSDDRNGEMGTLRFFRCMGLGRWLLLHLHELFAFDSIAGPNVLLLSGTSWAGNSPNYHIQVPVDAVLRAPETEVEAIGASTFSFDYLLDRDDQPISVSGRRGDARRRAIRDMLWRLSSPSGLRSGSSRLERELEDLPSSRQRILILVGSYDEARNAHADLVALRPDWSDRVLYLEPDDAEFSSRWISGLRRGEVERFASTGASLLIAPLLAMERGHNILNDENAAALGSVYFLVRPHPHPEDISFAVHAIAQWAIERDGRPLRIDPSRPLWIRSQAFRGRANAEWRRLLGLPLVYGNLRGVHHEEVTWSQLVSIWQVIGRLVRGGSPARVHFCDARFAERSAHHQEGETPYTSLLVGMREVLAPYFEERPSSAIGPRDVAVARLLYEPLFRALDRIEGVADVARV